MSSSASLTSGVAGRYATALFELAKEGNSLPTVESDLQALEAALAESADLRKLISSPIYSREDLGYALRALVAKMGIGAEVGNTLGLMAKNRRLFVLPELIAQIKAMIAADRGEVQADVTTARELSPEQTDALAAALKGSVGSDIRLNVKVDESLIGGLVVKVGSKMIDTSVRAKLASLQNVMKEVG
ncbi:MAG: F0F1 ATP synthase subunit delta [Rhodobacteraceae bacterium]|uniref:F0F1 ATP synthase subunit delta n=1 Tax=Amaricoccus sp. B4 TaxID=3368557 RepID=UPI000DAD947E|nr:F0F1 ATP synthase subunit delta [Paracoccaceae bacterium]